MTPYRFTKFYNPNMPSSLPLTVFIEKSARYAIANSLSWIRAGIAIAFWLLLLPYFMRRGWSYMFWLSRESWTSSPSALAELASTFGNSIQLSSTTLGLDVCPATPLLAPTTTPAKDFADMARAQAGASTGGSWLEGVYWALGLKDGQLHKSDSLLSDVKFFNTLTKNATINEAIISVLEGQLVTVVAMVSFILIILVRDYVVQQQPELNIREGVEREHQAGEQPPVAVQPAHVPDGGDSDDSEDEDNPLPGTPAGLGEGREPPSSTGHSEEHVPDDLASEGLDNTPDTSTTGSGDATYTPSADSPAEQSELGDVAGPSDRLRTELRQAASPYPLEHDAGPSRQRSVSDGAQIQTSVNPLANNTWSFATPSVSADETAAEGADDISRNDQRESGSAHSYESVATSGSTANGVVGGRGSEHESPSGQGESDEPDSRPPNAAGGITGFMYGDIEHRYQEVVAQPETVQDDGDHAIDWEDIPMDGEDELPNPLAEQAHNANGGDAVAAANADIDAANDENEAALDAEAIEDMEDFEGIMDLLGMRGPITNLFQNVVFCAVLVQSALTMCVFIPFNVGRVFFWFVDRPERLLRILFEVSKVVQDSVFILFGATAWMVMNLIDMVTAPFGGSLAAHVVYARKGGWELAWASANRVGQFMQLFFADLFTTSSGMQHWSATSHGALLNIKSRAALVVELLGQAMGGHPGKAFGALLSDPSSLYRLSVVDTNSSVDLNLAYWSATDITLAVFAGYFFLVALAALYVKSGIRLTRGSAIEEWETGLVDTLHQASGVFKVITIISIEMLVFPLYCGLLLDCALLPLFSGASVTSRLLFTRDNPWTSVFVHWFVGTGYMFHFALFVSMCRKIMRPGVLCKFYQYRFVLDLTLADFIRDPDDPDFHPVRDVLDRNLTTQLRKIMFSAFVYGALVIVCLGGVVWGLAFVAPGVLPIHYSSNEPILEFPLDLLFYNFVMPFSLKLLKPDQNLLVLFKWCFRKSARVLRLTYFLFGQRRLEEEGTISMPEQAENSLQSRLFLGLNAKQEVAVKSWKDFLDGIEPERSHTSSRTSSRRKHKRLSLKKAKLVAEGSLIPDGRFVRAPATDRIKIPKGTKVFLDVNEEGERQDGKANDDLYSTLHFNMVYIPPNFLRRIFLFILAIWTFAAIIGVGVTIIPLLVGRLLFTLALPDHVRTNDVYAFCIGFHILGFGLVFCEAAWQAWSERKLWHWLGGASDKKMNVVLGITRALKLVFAYTSMFVICPILIAVLVELYISLPIHSVLHPPGTSDSTPGKSQHGLRVMELWTMGLLYMRLLIKLSHSFMRNTRFNLAREAVLDRGWRNPDIKILVKAFILPGSLFAAAAIFVPPAVVAALESYGVFGQVLADEPGYVAERILRYRHSYPVAAFLAVSVKHGTLLKSSFDSLKAQVRDDTYLMGERLQNYDGSPAQASASAPAPRVAPVG